MRKRKLQRSVILALFALTGNAYGNASAENDFIFKSVYGEDENEDYPICKELLKIVNRAENNDAMSERKIRKEIIFPPENKNFSFVTWQPITLEDAKSLTPDGYLDEIIEAETKYALNVNKDWDGKGDFLFQKAEIDIDNNPPAETMLRYRIPVFKSWNCFLSKDAPDPGRDYFNPEEISHKGCQPVFYGGRVYIIYNDLNYMRVSKPVSAAGYEPELKRWNMFKKNICNIKRINNKGNEKCQKIRTLMVAKDIHDFSLPYEEIDGGTDMYLKIDIDKDGIEDSIVRSRGYGQEKIQSLFIAFSKTGQKLEKEMDPFFIINIENEFFAIENYSQIFSLKPDGVVKVCKLK